MSLRPIQPFYSKLVTEIALLVYLVALYDGLTESGHITKPIRYKIIFLRVL